MTAALNHTGKRAGHDLSKTVLDARITRQLRLAFGDNITLERIACVPLGEMFSVPGIGLPQCAQIYGAMLAVNVRPVWISDPHFKARMEGPKMRTTITRMAHSPCPMENDAAIDAIMVIDQAIAWTLNRTQGAQHASPGNALLDYAHATSPQGGEKFWNGYLRLLRSLRKVKP